MTKGCEDAGPARWRRYVSRPLVSGGRPGEAAAFGSATSLAVTGDRTLRASPDGDLSFCEAMAGGQRIVARRELAQGEQALTGMHGRPRGMAEAERPGLSGVLSLRPYRRGGANWNCLWCASAAPCAELSDGRGPHVAGHEGRVRC